MGRLLARCMTLPLFRKIVATKVTTCGCTPTNAVKNKTENELFENGIPIH